MSYSVSFTGTPENVVSELEAQSNNLSGDSKTEYDSALPNLINLVKLNTNQVIIEASGHAYETDGNKFSQCIVSIKQL